ncbi:TlpA family protein disulfide reductase [Azospirillum sp.]|uniref:TlpA family protein disulfide reductase n=1 Tax=Azospirillum sp. TaxID=34012 RepID=UPI003D74593B
MVCVVLGVAAWAGLGRAGVRGPEVIVLGADQPATKTAGIDRFKGGEAKPIKPFAFVDGQGRKVELADFAGRTVLLNLWATWCAPCVKEMPSLDRLQAALGGRDFQVVALSVDRGGRDTVEPFLKKLGIKNLEPYFDQPSASMTALGPRGLPTTLLVGPDGQELGRVEGDVEWDSPEVVAFLRKQIGGSRGPARGNGMVRTGG